MEKQKGKMIEVVVRFWTNNLPEDVSPAEGKAFAWDSGEVYIRKDEVNGVRTEDPHFFTERAKLDDKISEALADAGVVLVHKKK